MFSLSAQRSSRHRQRKTAERPSGLGRLTRESAGFSMPEILAVLLIIGILAAIAIAVFSSQPAKAMGAHAKEEARLAQTTAQTIATETGGDYSGLSPAELNRTESALSVTPSTTEPWVSSAEGKDGEYEIVIKTPSGDEFKIAQNPAGEVSRTCANATTKQACAGAESGSW